MSQLEAVGGGWVGYWLFGGVFGERRELEMLANFRRSSLDTHTQIQNLCVSVCLTRPEVSLNSAGWGGVRALFNMPRRPQILLNPTPFLLLTFFICLFRFIALSFSSCNFYPTNYIPKFQICQSKTPKWKCHNFHFMLFPNFAGQLEPLSSQLWFQQSPIHVICDGK